MASFHPYGERGELDERLIEHVEAIARCCLTDLDENKWEVRGRGPGGGMWCVSRRGHKRGIVLDTGSGRGTDLFGLIMHTVCGGEIGRTYRWIRSWLHLDDETPVERAKWKARAAQAAEQRRMASLADDARRSRAAKAIYVRGTEARPSDPVGQYLAGRGLRPVRALRFGHRFYDDQQGELPAMLAPINCPQTRVLLAVHQTFLQHASSGWTKTALRPAKKVFGPMRGGIIPLVRGSTGRPWAEARDGEELLIGEGIENVLTASLREPDLRAIAAVSVGNLAAIDLPPAFASVVLVADRDGENDDVRAAQERAERRWLEEGRAVSRLEPPAGHKDWNAYWQHILEETAHAA